MKSMLAAALTLFLSALNAGCSNNACPNNAPNCRAASGAATGQATVTGSAGVDFSGTLDVQANTITCASNPESSTAYVVIGTEPGVCAAAGAPIGGENLLVLELYNYNPGGTAPAIGPGTYTIPTTQPPPNGPNAQVFISQTTGACYVDEYAFASGATITVSSIFNGVISGSFSAVFGNATIIGSFTSASCPATQTQVCDGPAPLVPTPTGICD